jgi:hypothetical protein
MPKCLSLAGNAKGAILWELASFDVNQLRTDLAKVVEGWDWSSGSFGHSLPLTTKRLSSFGAGHYNNLVKQDKGGSLQEAPDRLEECPGFRRIFDSFSCEKSSFRILRRPGNSSYTLHKDNDVGDGVYRFQIPLITNPDVRLLVSTINDRAQFVVPAEDFRKVEDWKAQGISTDRLKAWVDEFVKLNGDKVCVYQAEPGKLYYFDTRNYHNVWNFGADPRFTLSIDLVANEWLHGKWPEVFARS